MSSGGAFQGTVTVNATAGALSVQAAPQAVVFGGRTTVSGKLASGQTGQTVQVLAQQCGANAAKAVGSATTTTGGAFTLSVQPLQNTVYTAKLKNATSNSPIAPARRLRRTESCPSDGSMREDWTTSSETGSAPELMRSDSSFADAVVKFPSMMPLSRMRALSDGADMIWPSSTIARPPLSASIRPSTLSHRGRQV